MSIRAPILEVSELSSSYTVEYMLFFRKKKYALKDVHFNLFQGETLAITGDAGSGKTTLLKILLGQEKYNKGDILIHGKPYFDYERKDRAAFIRMLYPNYETSLNPHLRINKSLTTTLKLNTQLSEKEITNKIIKTLEFVGLPAQVRHYYPNSLTHNQKLRLSLAQALILQPKILLIDASIEKLDPQIKAHFINLLIDIQERHQTSIIICLNDIGLISHIADKILVLNQGVVEDYGAVEAVFESPNSEFTKRLKLSYNHEYRVFPKEK